MADYLLPLRLRLRVGGGWVISSTVFQSPPPAAAAVLPPRAGRSLSPRFPPPLSKTAAPLDPTQSAEDQNIPEKSMLVTMARKRWSGATSSSSASLALEIKLDGEVTHKMRARHHITTTLQGSNPFHHR